ncbi:dihydropteroate synthase [Subtercola vilae]|uniref:Dihydropteroate synthase n=1 Tax=Subtercola vilae TaxID=2056433 RepID=A0A4T2C107_9MICO|nr:dihydropteroate synthase [Subtercola vilae]TIH37667.1 dihydropteroate synthase [Subtercola vilae]
MTTVSGAPDARAAAAHTAARPTGLYLPPLAHPVRTVGQRTFDFSRQIAVMAIVNRTPDSFYDRGATFALDKAIEAGISAANEGADWVDVGGVPFAPGPELAMEAERDRVIPVIEGLSAASDVVISVDTFRAEVAAAAIRAGASVINDTTGIREPRLADVVADSEATLVITHSLATPRQSHPRPQYADVAGEVAEFLQRRVDFALSRGVREDRIVVDPGHDLNKNTRQTLELTRRLGEVAALGFPTLAAVSNKDFVGESLGRDKPDRLEGSLAAATVSVMLGARIVRMHQVRASVDAMRMVEAILGWRQPVSAVHNV